VSSPKFDFPRTLVITGNLAILGWVLLASLSFMFVNQLYGWLFLLFAAATIFLILRRLGCSSCYNCKSCTSGFGRLAGWLFGDRSTKDMNNKTALVFMAIIYFLLIAFPVSILAVSVFQEFTAPKILVLSGLLLLTAYSVFTWIRPSYKAQQV
jgi:hypothetical protein